MTNPFEIFALANNPSQDVTSPESVKLLPDNMVCVVYRFGNGLVTLVAICQEWRNAVEICDALPSTVAIQRQGDKLHRRNGVFSNLRDAIL